MSTGVGIALSLAAAFIGALAGGVLGSTILGAARIVRRGAHHSRLTDREDDDDE